MGLIDRLFGLIFGGERNAIAETVEVFRANAEKSAARDADRQAAALSQFAAEFAHPRRAAFDVFIDGLNRIPRPAMALGTLGLFVSAMVSPEWFASRMVGVAVVPEPLWWLLGAIVSFYFGARHQIKGQEFQRAMAASIAHLPVAASAAGQDASAVKEGRMTNDTLGGDPAAFADNAALRDWVATRRD